MKANDREQTQVRDVQPCPIHTKFDTEEQSRTSLPKWYQEISIDNSGFIRILVSATSLLFYIIESLYLFTVRVSMCIFAFCIHAIVTLHYVLGLVPALRIPSMPGLITHT